MGEILHVARKSATDLLVATSRLAAQAATLAAVLFILAVSACAAPLHIVAVDTREQPDTAATIAAACAVWRVRCELTTDEIGAIVVTIVDRDAAVGDGRIGGQATYRPCRSRAWSIAEANVLAHELGHALGLRHVEDDAANVMHPKPGTQVTARQLLRVRAHVAALSACPGSDSILD